MKNYFMSKVEMITKGDVYNFATGRELWLLRIES
jgi:hypothetical protein